MAWISLSLFCLELIKLLESVHLCLLPNLGTFQPLLFQILFQTYILSPLLLMTPKAWMLDLLLQSNSSLRLYFFSQCFSFLFLCLDGVIPIVLSFSSSVLFSVFSVLMFSPSSDFVSCFLVFFFLWLLYFFGSKVSILVLLFMFYVSIDTFYFFP